MAHQNGSSRSLNENAYESRQLNLEAISGESREVPNHRRVEEGRFSLREEDRRTHERTSRVNISSIGELLRSFDGTDGDFEGWEQ